MKLVIEDLAVSFGERCVASVPRLALHDGLIVGIAGESGSGKSMTATALLGLAERIGATVTGSITLDGTELVGASEATWRSVRGRRIAMIFQSPSGSFNPVMKIGVTFSRAQRLHGERSKTVRRRHAAAALDEVLLTAAVLDRYPHELSGGQLQRISIALALALRADIVLADEPTSALDVTVQAEILDLIRRLRDREQLAMLFISHDLGAIADVSEQVFVMRAGGVVESGMTRDVLSHPADPYTRALIDAVPTLDSPQLGGDHA
jgi:peptide/nickel transport system ATP-binding protein